MLSGGFSKEPYRRGFSFLPQADYGRIGKNARVSVNVVQTYKQYTVRSDTGGEHGMPPVDQYVPDNAFDTKLKPLPH